MPACSFFILTLNLVLTHGIPPDVHGGVGIFLPAPHTIGLVPSLSGRAIAYRWRSLPRVRWHRPVGLVLKVARVTGAAVASPWTKCYCAPLFSHTNFYWNTVSMFKLSGVYQNIDTAVELLLYCFVEPFPPPTYGLYKYTCKEFSVHGTISSYVVFQNIVITAVLSVDPFSPSRLLSVVYMCEDLEFRVRFEAFYGNDHGKRKHIHH